MNILVLEKDQSANNHPVWNYIRSKGHNVYVGPFYKAPLEFDALISWGISSMPEISYALEWATKHNERIKAYFYNWDCYEWVWSHPRGKQYDYTRYGELLRFAWEVWVPSVCTGVRTHQWWPWVKENQIHVIKSTCPYWEYDNVRDDGYALCCLREIPDPWWGKFESTCEELGIPYKSLKHEATEKQYRDAVAGCRFICAPLYELSTGGLSLMEAYYHGKPVLLSDSQWNGGRDYFGNRARYFNYGNGRTDDFKSALLSMYRGIYKTPPDHKEWIKTNYSDERLAKDILTRLEI